MSDPSDLAADAAACRQLWAAVLLAGLDDARRPDATLAARAWPWSADAATVASLAGLDHEAMLSALSPRPRAPEGHGSFRGAGRIRVDCARDFPSHSAQTHVPPQHTRNP